MAENTSKTRTAWAIERPDEEQKEPEKNDIFRTNTGEPDHDLIYWLQNS